MRCGWFASAPVRLFSIHSVRAVVPLVREHAAWALARLVDQRAGGDPGGSVVLVWAVTSALHPPILRGPVRFGSPA